MKLIILIQALLFSAFAYGDKLFLAIDCDDEVRVYASCSDLSSAYAVIEFMRDGDIVREQGSFSVRSDKSLVASSKSAVVYGNPQGTGYFILAPSRRPYPGGCISL